MANETILVLDFGSQYTQLIARRIREQNVYCEIVPHSITADELRSRPGLRGLILSGGPASVYGEGAPQPDPAIFTLDVPKLGICYGLQVGAQIMGGQVTGSQLREYGRTSCRLVDSDPLLEGLESEITVWMSHGDAVTDLGDDFVRLGETDSTAFCIVRHRELPFWGIQFHPEVTHTPRGRVILSNFLHEICGCSGDWKMSDFGRQAVEAIRAQVPDGDRVICGLSGGVDSAVTAKLIHEAIGERLACIFVDNGLLREGEFEEVSAKRLLRRVRRSRINPHPRRPDAGGMLLISDGVPTTTP